MLSHYNVEIVNNRLTEGCFGVTLLMCFQAPLVSGHAGMKFTVMETLDHIKEEFQLFQAQYHRYRLMTFISPHPGGFLAILFTQTLQI